MPTNTSINTPNRAKTYLEPGHATTGKAAATITGKRFVKVAPGGVGNHPNVVPGTLAGPVYGVSHYDVANGGHVSILRGGTFEVTAGETLLAGDEVMSGAAGVAMKVTTGNRPCGVATADTANGTGAPVTLYL